MEKEELKQLHKTVRGHVRRTLAKLRYRLESSASLREELTRISQNGQRLKPKAETVLGRDPVGIVRRFLSKAASEDVARLIEAHLGLVQHCAIRYSKLSGRSKEEFLTSAYVGLVRAVGGYDPKKGAAFSTYAYPWIRHFILRQLQADNQEDEHIHLQMPIGARRRQKSDGPRDTHDDGFFEKLTLEDMIGTEDPAYAAFEKLEIRSYVRSALGTLPESQQNLLEDGIMADKDDAMSLDRLGGRLRLSREGARRRRERTLSQLRKQLDHLNA